MLIERFFEEATGKKGCAEDGAKLLASTAHLVKARSVAVAATQCVFMARLGETMGVRGFYHSVLPGKGEEVHLVLALAFPKVFYEYVDTGTVNYDGIVEWAYDQLSLNGVIEPGRIEREEVTDTAKELVRAGVEFVEMVFRRVIGNSNEAREALARSRVLVEQQLMSYRLHVWGVADVIVEDPVKGVAAVIEWKTYIPEAGKTPQIAKTDIAQACVYAMLEAERLGLAGDSFEGYVAAVLGRDRDGRGARVVPGVIRPSPTGRASRIVARHPLVCVGVRSGCNYDELRGLLAALVLAAEHLTLSVTSTRRHLHNARNVEQICSVKGRDGRERPVFRRVPELRISGMRIWLPMGNPRREELKWPCNVCPDNVREACLFFIGQNLDPHFADFDAFRREAWRARFAVYDLRENALEPYKSFRELALRYGSDMGWIRGHLATRVLPDGSRVDLFDEALVDGDELVLIRPALRWENENQHLVTLREGKPTAVILDEGHVKDPLLRVSFHGIVKKVDYDDNTKKVIVRIVPANRLSRIYPIVLAVLREKFPEMFSNVVALEVNVELTQLELLGVTAAELGTVRKGVEAIEKVETGKSLEAEEALALLFGGVELQSREGERKG